MKKVRRFLDLIQLKNALVFHAGAKRQDNKVITSGGRVMAQQLFWEQL